MEQNNQSTENYDDNHMTLWKTQRNITLTWPSGSSSLLKQQPIPAKIVWDKFLTSVWVISFNHV